MFKRETPGSARFAHHGHWIGSCIEQKTTAKTKKILDAKLIQWKPDPQEARQTPLLTPRQRWSWHMHSMGTDDNARIYACLMLCVRPDCAFDTQYVVACDPSKS